MGNNDVITLISTSYTQDSLGQFTKTETSRTVFAGVTSVTGSEFFTAGQAGVSPEFRATIDLLDYADETEAEYNGKRYGIYRTYQTRNGSIELYLERKTGVTNG